MTIEDQKGRRDRVVVLPQGGKPVPDTAPATTRSIVVGNLNYRGY